jgi:maleamate amidohydrolase
MTTYELAGDAPHRTWSGVIPQEDLLIYEAAGYGGDVQPGSRPAVLVIDVTYGFAGREPLPTLESISRYPNSCGQAAWAAIDVIRTILPRARDSGAPVFYTIGTSKGALIGRWRDKHPRTRVQPVDAFEIVTEVAPVVDDVVLEKTKPSAFHGTPLLAMLIDRQIDTLVVTGGTTSGCIRATVIDAFSYGFRVLIVEEAVFDRGVLSHAVNLFDMQQKYANVLSQADTLAYLENLDRPLDAP